MIESAIYIRHIILNLVEAAVLDLLLHLGNLEPGTSYLMPATEFSTITVLRAVHLRMYMYSMDFLIPSFLEY